MSLRANTIEDEKSHGNQVSKFVTRLPCPQLRTAAPSQQNKEYRHRSLTDNSESNLESACFLNTRNGDLDNANFGDANRVQGTNYSALQDSKTEHKPSFAKRTLGSRRAIFERSGKSPAEKPVEIRNYCEGVESQRSLERYSIDSKSSLEQTAMHNEATEDCVDSWTNKILPDSDRRLTASESLDLNLKEVKSELKHNPGFLSRGRFLSSALPPNLFVSCSFPSDQVYPVKITNTKDRVAAFISHPRLTQRIRLVRGNVISFSEVGEYRGWPVFCFPGMGLTRYVMSFYDVIAKNLGIRLITLDRPGQGFSDSVDLHETCVADWVDTLSEICQALEIQNFSLLGHSVGALYALAVARKMPDRIKGRVYLLAPFIPQSQLQIERGTSTLPTSSSHRLLNAIPTVLLRGMSKLLSSHSPRITSQWKTPAKCHSQEYSFNLPEEQSRPEYDKQLTEAIWQSSIKPVKALDDLIMCLERHKSIGFKFQDVQCPVRIIHGYLDSRVPLDHARYAHNILPDSEIEILQNAGHEMLSQVPLMSSVLEALARDTNVSRNQGGSIWRMP